MPCHGPEPGWLIAYLDAPATIAGWILNITDSYIGIYLLLIAFLLVIGTFLSPLSAIIIFMPIFQQLAAVGGFNDIHSRLREILVQQNPHARAKLYGVSSNLASDPAKSNTAEMSSDVMLG